MAEPALEVAGAGGEEAPTAAAATTLLPAKRKYTHSEERIVWPPVVIIENTLTNWDAERKTWKGLENEEIRSFLKGVKDLQYGRVMALYGKQGNRGKSLVIFPATPLGFMDAQALCECLERDRRGHFHWLQVSHGKGSHDRDPLGPVTADGKKILYGYLASERDMLDADYKKKIVKRWSMESYFGKVLLPLEQIETDKEEARKKTAELVEEAKQKLLAVEHNKSEFGKAAAEFKKINDEIHHQKKQEEELEATHRRNFEQRKRHYEEESSRKVEQSRNREKEIRGRLLQNKIAKENNVIEYEKVARRLKDGIDMEKKNHEVRLAEQKQMEAMDLMKLDSMLQLKMEEKLALLKKKFREKQLKLQEQHNEQIMKSREAISAERESLLQSKLKELETIEKEVKEAKSVTQQKQQEAEECIICFHEFGKERMERAFFPACSHANICSECAKGLWKAATAKKTKLLCPTCNTAQNMKYTLLPARIYS